MLEAKQSRPAAALLKASISQRHREELESGRSTSEAKEVCASGTGGGNRAGAFGGVSAALLWIEKHKGGRAMLGFHSIGLNGRQLQAGGGETPLRPDQGKPVP